MRCCDGGVPRPGGLERPRARKYFSRWGLMSQSIPTGYIPPDNPRGLAQKTCPGGRDLIFESCTGAGNSTRAGIMWKMKLKLQKNSVDQILQVKKKQGLRVFQGLPIFSIEFFLVYGSIFWFYCHTYLTKNLRSCPWLVYSKFSLGYSYPHLLFA